jgi:hypothetical protein
MTLMPLRDSPVNGMYQAPGKQQHHGIPRTKPQPMPIGASTGGCASSSLRVWLSRYESPPPLRHGRICAITNVPRCHRTPHVRDAAGAAPNLGAIYRGCSFPLPFLLPPPASSARNVPVRLLKHVQPLQHNNERV